MLRGTNTIERIAASSQLLFELSKENACIFAATHDIELTYILSEIFENKHFEEEVKDDDVKFDYQLKKERATSRNAIKLLKIMGFGNSVVENANRAVKSFEDQNRWSRIDGGTECNEETYILECKWIKSSARKGFSRLL